MGPKTKPITSKPTKEESGVRKKSWVDPEHLGNTSLKAETGLSATLQKKLMNLKGGTGLEIGKDQNPRRL